MTRQGAFDFGPPDDGGYQNDTPRPKDPRGRKPKNRDQAETTNHDTRGARPMIDMANILIRRVNSRGSTYGAPVPHDDLPYAVLEAVECEVIEAGEDEGKVEVGGESWQWRKGESSPGPWRENQPIEVDVMDYATGARLGGKTVYGLEWGRYAAGVDEAYQWPEGTARARDVLTAAEIERMDVRPSTMIYLDGPG